AWSAPEGAQGKPSPARRRPRHLDQRRIVYIAYSLAPSRGRGVGGRPLLAYQHGTFFFRHLRLDDEAARAAGAGAPLADQLKRRLDAGIARRAANGERGDHGIFSSRRETAEIAVRRDFGGGREVRRRMGPSPKCCGNGKQLPLQGLSTS